MSKEIWYIVLREEKGRECLLPHDAQGGSTKGQTDQPTQLHSSGARAILGLTALGRHVKRGWRGKPGTSHGVFLSVVTLVGGSHKGYATITMSMMSSTPQETNRMLSLRRSKNPSLLY